MAYAVVSDVQSRMLRELSSEEQSVCENLLDDAAVMIDVFAPEADDGAKKIVSCRMVIRAIGDGGASGIPIGANQATQSALGYSQTWTYPTAGSSGEMYLSKLEKQMLRSGNSIGAYSPVQELVPTSAEVLP